MGEVVEGEVVGVCVCGRVVVGGGRGGEGGVGGEVAVCGIVQCGGALGTAVARNPPSTLPNLHRTQCTPPAKRVRAYIWAPASHTGLASGGLNLGDILLCLCRTPDLYKAVVLNHLPNSDLIGSTPTIRRDDQRCARLPGRWSAVDSLRMEVLQQSQSRLYGSLHHAAKGVHSMAPQKSKRP